MTMRLGMHPLTESAGPLLAPSSLIGAVAIGLVVLCICATLAWFTRRTAKRLEHRLSDVTVLQFASVFVQMLIYLFGIAAFAHIVPELRTLGTALLAGASIISVVIDLAAQDTLGNLIAGFSLVLSKAIRVGDDVRIYSPVGTISARVKEISLGFTSLIDEESNEVVIPNGVIMNGAVVRIVNAAKKG